MPRCVVCGDSENLVLDAGRWKCKGDVGAVTMKEQNRAVEKEVTTARLNTDRYLTESFLPQNARKEAKS